jgi:hypothetical protein
VVFIYDSGVPMLTDWDEGERLLIRVWDGIVGAEEWHRVGPNAWTFPDMRRMLADVSRWDRDPSIDSRVRGRSAWPSWRPESSGRRTRTIHRLIAAVGRH